MIDPPPTRVHSNSRIEEQRGWVVEMSGCIAGWAHPLEKSPAILKNTSIYCLLLKYAVGCSIASLLNHRAL